MKPSNIRVASGSRSRFPLAGLLLLLIASVASVNCFAVTSKPTITSFSASPTTTVASVGSKLTWVTSGATSITITPGTFSTTIGNYSTTVKPAATTTYTLTATNAAGSVTATVTIAVTPPPTIDSFTASPASIPRGSSTTLAFNIAGATSVVITPGTFTSTSACGSTTVAPTSTTTYTLKATNSAGSVTATVTVVVTPPPTIQSFKANPGTMISGSAQLSWSTTGATSITITPGSITSTATSGTANVEPAATTKYTLTATNSAGSVTAMATVTVTPLATINSFTASPASIAYGSSSTLSYSVSDASSADITPGSFKSTALASGTAVSPTTTTTYTLTVHNAYGIVTATTTVTVTYPMPIITTTSCPTGTQNTAYAGCTISVMGGKPPYTFAVETGEDYAPLPEGMSLDESTGIISAPIIGGQGVYSPQFIVTDANGNQVKGQIAIPINGNNKFMAKIFPANSIFHHRVDAATTGLPVDNSPAAPIYIGYQPVVLRAEFGTENGYGFPFGIPAIEVPYNQSGVGVSTTKYQSYFTSGPIPAYAPVEGTSYSTQDRHVLVYVDGGAESSPALYEMWGSIYEEGPWTDGSNALWTDVTSNNLTPQSKGTADAAGLPIAPLLLNADEVIGDGTPTEPNGVVQHPVRFTLNHILNNWVWPATQTAGDGYCTLATGKNIPVGTLISQSAPPATCTFSGPPGEIYRLKASVPTPACAASSPQTAIIITGLRNYGMILADGGDSGGLIGTPDARWSTEDLLCLRSLALGDFEPVDVSSLMISNDSAQTSK